jgi:hypothetical protein
MGKDAKLDDDGALLDFGCKSALSKLWGLSLSQSTADIYCLKSAYGDLRSFGSVSYIATINPEEPKYEPFGVCALITPWNVPSLLLAKKIEPCLATGNTCVVKPPSINSGIGLKLAEIISEEDLPPGIINFVAGREARSATISLRIPALTASASPEVLK